MKQRKRSYKRQLLIYFAAVFSLFAILLILFQFRSDTDNRKRMLQDRLSCYADIVSKSHDYAATVAMFPSELRVTVIGMDGKVLFDSVEDETTLDNHASRPEVRKIRKIRGPGNRAPASDYSISFLYFTRCGSVSPPCAFFHASYSE